MKICPQCSFANDERFPTCAYCNASIADVRPADSIAPSSAETESRSVTAARRRFHNGQIRSASWFYACAITFTALCPGCVIQPAALLSYFLVGFLIASLISRGVLGPLSASTIQGLLSVLLIVVFGTAFFGRLNPLLPFTLLSHIVLPILFCHWTTMIHDAHR